MTTIFLAAVFSIIDIVLNVTIGTLQGLFNIPSQLPVGVTASFTLFRPIWLQLQNIFPMDVLFQVLILILATEIVVRGFKLVLWLWKKIPFIGK